MTNFFVYSAVLGFAFTVVSLWSALILYKKHQIKPNETTSADVERLFEKQITIKDSNKKNIQCLICFSYKIREDQIKHYAKKVKLYNNPKPSLLYKRGVFEKVEIDWDRFEEDLKKRLSRIISDNNDYSIHRQATAAISKLAVLIDKVEVNPHYV